MGLERPRRIAILGSTGSIGCQALDIVRRNPDRFTVVGLSAGGGQPDLLAAQAAEFSVAEVGTGAEGAAHVAGLECDVVLNGIAGAAGLVPTIRALEAGGTLALANKESLIIGGPVVQRIAAPGQIVPVDSEHSALAQCLRGGAAHEVRRLVLTASGGPLRGRSAASLADVTPAEALAHPTWSMGPLVTINSATLVNKGLEVIEAHLLFGVPLDRIDVVVHPQSIVHSMVEFVDGSTIAQASPPDMRLPIALGLAWPDRVPDAAPGLDWSRAAAWEFEPLDEGAFPAVRVARRAAAAGGTAPAVFNAADEVAVAAFLAGRLPFPGIVETVAEVLDAHLDAHLDADLDANLGRAAPPAEVDSGAGRGDTGGNPLTLEDVLAADAWGRAAAAEAIVRRQGEPVTSEGGA